MLHECTENIGLLQPLSLTSTLTSISILTSIWTLTSISFLMSTTTLTSTLTWTSILTLNFVFPSNFDFLNHELNLKLFFLLKHQRPLVSCTITWNLTLTSDKAESWTRPKLITRPWLTLEPLIKPGGELSLIFIRSSFTNDKSSAARFSLRS